MSGEEAVLARLGSAFDAVDPVPLAAYEAAVAGLALRDVDAELAELAADSVLADSGVRTRPATGPRLLTFTAGELSIEVEVADDGARRRLLGQLVPPQPAEIDVHWDGGASTVTTDQLGRFSVVSVPAGLVSMVCQLTDPARRVATSWVSI
ncbi:MAG: hypothetical protein GEV07_01645 [Streptosporangiales bacterium]|nr:hypothetical protein [Streptosporangiales bacterium]